MSLCFTKREIDDRWTFGGCLLLQLGNRLHQQEKLKDLLLLEVQCLLKIHVISCFIKKKEITLSLNGYITGQGIFVNP